MFYYSTVNRGRDEAPHRYTFELDYTTVYIIAPGAKPRRKCTKKQGCRYEFQFNTLIGCRTINSPRSQQCCLSFSHLCRRSRFRSLLSLFLIAAHTAAYNKNKKHKKRWFLFGQNAHITQSIAETRNKPPGLPVHKVTKFITKKIVYCS